MNDTNSHAQAQVSHRSFNPSSPGTPEEESISGENFPHTYWERVAESRWGRYITEIQLRTILSAHELVKPGRQAIEVGCDGGRWSKMLQSLGWRLVCTDIDQQSLEICKRRVPSATCIHVDSKGTLLPVPSAEFEYLLCSEVFPVIESDWFIGEAHRVLRQNGVLVGIFHNSHSIRGWFSRIRDVWRGRNGFRYYTKSYPVFRRQMVNQGFEIVYERGFCWFPFARDSNSVLIPGAIALEKLLGLSAWISASPWVAFVARKATGVEPIKMKR